MPEIGADHQARPAHPVGPSNKEYQTSWTLRTLLLEA